MYNTTQQFTVTLLTNRIEDCLGLAVLELQIAQQTAVTTQTLEKEYHIENVELQSYVSPSKTNGGSKFTTGTMTVFEPYGSTLLENIVKASVDGSINPPSPNYLQIPYMLKISFKGYDDQCNPLDTTFLRPERKESK